MKPYVWLLVFHVFVPGSNTSGKSRSRQSAMDALLIALTP